jgi:hypothetical protein
MKAATWTPEELARRICRPRVVCSYRLAGHTLTGDQVAFGLNICADLLDKAARRYLGKYPKVKSVLIYYNPGRSEQSVLEPGEKRGAVKLVYGGCFLCFLSAMGIFLLLVLSHAIN